MRHERFIFRKACGRIEVLEQIDDHPPYVVDDVMYDEDYVCRAVARSGRPTAKQLREITNGGDELLVVERM